MFIVQTEFLKSVVECALMSVGLEHREANASVMKFFYDLFRAGRTREHDPDFEVSTRYSDPDFEMSARYSDLDFEVRARCFWPPLTNGSGSCSFRQ